MHISFYHFYILIYAAYLWIALSAFGAPLCSDRCERREARGRAARRLRTPGVLFAVWDSRRESGVWMSTITLWSPDTLIINEWENLKQRIVLPIITTTKYFPLAIITDKLPLLALLFPWFLLLLFPQKLIICYTRRNKNKIGAKCPMISKSGK